MGNLWAKIALNLAENPKIIGLSDSAFRAFIESILWSRQHMTDGFLDQRIVAAKWPTVIDELLSNDAENPSWVRVDGGFLIHHFCDYQTTSDDVALLREKKKAAGKASAEARKQHNANTMPTHVQHNANTASTVGQPETETETETENISSASDDAGERKKNLYSDDFEKFWVAYPRKMDKGKAFKAFERLRKAKVLPDLNVLIDAATKYGLENATQPQFIKMAEGWLNGHRWTDQPLTATFAIETSLRRQRELAHSDSIRAEIDGMKRDAVPAPTCRHDKVLVLCRICVKEAADANL